MEEPQSWGSRQYGCDHNLLELTWAFISAIAAIAATALVAIDLLFGNDLIRRLSRNRPSWDAVLFSDGASGWKLQWSLYNRSGGVRHFQEGYSVLFGPSSEISESLFPVESQKWVIDRHTVIWDWKVLSKLAGLDAPWDKPAKPIWLVTFCLYEGRLYKALFRVDLKRRKVRRRAWFWLTVALRDGRPGVSIGNTIRMIRTNLKPTD